MKHCKKTKNSTFHIQYIVWPHPFAYICFSQWGLLIQADRLCLWIHRAVLLTHAYLSWRCLCPLSGIWPQPYNQLSVINRNTGRTNLAVTTNKHLWGRLKASRGFLLHINTLDNTDAETRADTHTHTHIDTQSASSNPFICSEGYYPLLRIILICRNKRLRSLWIPW